MNKRTRKVLSLLKTKAKQLGFSRSELKGIAAKIADNLDLKDDASDEDEDSAIDEAVDDAMEFLNYSQSAAQRAISNFKKKHNVPDDDDTDENDDDVVDDNGRQYQQMNKKLGQQKGNKANKSNNKKEGDDDIDEDTPAWAKGLMTVMKSVSDRVSSLEKGNVSNSRKSRLEKILKDTGKFGERRLKEFDRIKETFKTDEEFDEYLDEISEDLDAYNQERADAGLAKLGVPGATSPDKKDITPQKDDDFKPLDEKDIKALANEF